MIKTLVIGYIAVASVVLGGMHVGNDLCEIVNSIKTTKQNIVDDIVKENFNENCYGKSLGEQGGRIYFEVFRDMEGISENDVYYGTFSVDTEWAYEEYCD